jgi:hypothetical protein
MFAPITTWNHMIELTQSSVRLFDTPSIRSAWWAVVARFLIHGLVVSTWVSRIPAIQTALGLTNARLGLCLLGTAVGSVVAVPVTGWLITRFGSKPVTTRSCRAILCVEWRSVVRRARALWGHGRRERCVH